MKKAIIGLGSNLGDSPAIVLGAWRYLGKQAGVETRVISSPYRTEPLGMTSVNWFINAVGVLETRLEPVELLGVLLRCEAHFGRVRPQPASGEGYQDRTLDLDLLMFQDVVLNLPELTLPHPRMQERLFVLAPLAEIEPDLIHPVSRLSVGQMLAEISAFQPTGMPEKCEWPVL